MQHVVRLSLRSFIPAFSCPLMFTVALRIHSLLLTWTLVGGLSLRLIRAQPALLGWERGGMAAHMGCSSACVNSDLLDVVTIWEGLWVLPKEKAHFTWIPRKSSVVLAPSKLWAVTCACSQPSDSCNLWDWDCIDGVLSTAFQALLALVVMSILFLPPCQRASGHILTATSPLPLPGIFRSSTSGPNLYSRQASCTSHFSWLPTTTLSK